MHESLPSATRLHEILSCATTHGIFYQPLRDGRKSDIEATMYEHAICHDIEVNRLVHGDVE